jgi:hypothetical protein
MYMHMAEGQTFKHSDCYLKHASLWLRVEAKMELGRDRRLGRLKDVIMTNGM